MRKQLIALGLILIISFIGYTVDTRGGADADELKPNIALMGLKDFINNEGAITVYGTNSNLKYVYEADTPNNEYGFVPLSVPENKLETTIYAYLNYQECIGSPSCGDPLQKFFNPILKIIQTKTVALAQTDPLIAEYADIPSVYTPEALAKLERTYGVIINPDRRARILADKPDFFFGSIDKPLLTKGYLANNKSLDRLVYVVTDFTTDYNLIDIQKAPNTPSVIKARLPEHSNYGYLRKIGDQYILESSLDSSIIYRIANSIYGDDSKRLPPTVRDSLDAKIGKKVFPGPHIVAGFGGEKIILTDSPELPILPQANYSFNLFEMILGTSDLAKTYDESGIVYRPAYSLSTSNPFKDSEIHFNDVIYSDSFYYDKSQEKLAVKDNITDRTYALGLTKLSTLSTIEAFHTNETTVTELKKSSAGWNILTNRESIRAKLTSDDECFSSEYKIRSHNIDCSARIYTYDGTVTMITVTKTYRSAIALSEVGRLSESDSDLMAKCENDHMQKPLPLVSIKPGQKPPALNLTVAPEYAEVINFKISEPVLLNNFFSFERFRSNVLARQKGDYNLMYAPTLVLEGDGWSRYLPYTCPDKNTFNSGLITLPPVDELKTIAKVLNFSIKPKYELYKYEPAERPSIDTTIKSEEAINIEAPCSDIDFSTRADITLIDSLDYTYLTYDTNLYLRIINNSNKDFVGWQFKLYDTLPGEKKPSETRPVRRIDVAPMLADQNLTQLRELKDVAYTTDQDVLIGSLPTIAAKSSREINLGSFKLNRNNLPVGIAINQGLAKYKRCKYFETLYPYSREGRIERLTKPNNGLATIANCNVTVEPKITVEFNPITRSKVYYGEGYDVAADNRSLSLKITNTDTVAHNGFAVVIADPKVMGLRPLDYPSKDSRKYTIPAQSSVVIELGTYEFKFLENVRLDLDERNAPTKANAMRDFYILHSISGTCGQLLTFVDTTMPFPLKPEPEPTPTATPTPVTTPIPTPTIVAISTPTPTATATPTPTATAAPKPSATPTPTAPAVPTIPTPPPCTNLAFRVRTVKINKAGGNVSDILLDLENKTTVATSANLSIISIADVKNEREELTRFPITKLNSTSLSSPKVTNATYVEPRLPVPPGGGSSRLAKRRTYEFANVAIPANTNTTLSLGSFTFNDRAVGVARHYKDLGIDNLTVSLSNLSWNNACDAKVVPVVIQSGADSIATPTPVPTATSTPTSTATARPRPTTTATPTPKPRLNQSNTLQQIISNIVNTILRR